AWALPGPLALPARIPAKLAVCLATDGGRAGQSCVVAQLHAGERRDPGQPALRSGWRDPEPDQARIRPPREPRLFAQFRQPDTYGREAGTGSYTRARAAERRSPQRDRALPRLFGRRTGGP